MGKAKKLIEVAMPVKEISAESVRDKSIRHGHISTLHLWWARRPLPVCRAVVFASLVPDPLDENCPESFVEAVEILLGSRKKPLMDPGMLVNAYVPYIDIPYTSAIDPMEDNPRNRLLMFIGKFSPVYIQNEKLGKTTPAKDLLADESLIKWDNKNNEKIINKARKLIWVAHNAKDRLNAKELLTDFDKHYNAIKNAEEELYFSTDRHKDTKDIKGKESKLQKAIDSFLDKMPKVFDPFAGGGAIPLEAARLGCKSYGNDINPVAHIIQKGSLEFPQKFGKPISFTKYEFEKLYGREELVRWCKENGKHADDDVLIIDIENRLSFDVKFYANKLLKITEKDVGLYYPKPNNGAIPVAYYWAYNAICSNPSCRAKVPLIKQFYLVNKPEKAIHLKPIISGNKISFEVKNGKIKEDPWIQRKNLKCPVCGNLTDIKELKRQFNNKIPDKSILAVIEEGPNAKTYRLPTDAEKKAIENLPKNISKPMAKMPIGNNRDLHCMGWGVEYWGDMFTERQLLLLNSLSSNLSKLNISSINNEYSNSIKCYLAIFVDRIAASSTAFGRWNVTGEKIETPFSRQAIPFMFDFPEANPFSTSTGSASNQLDWIIRYIESECIHPFETILRNATSGDQSQFQHKELDVVVTDPPYYDAIAYADLSDFFYVWLKQTLSTIFSLNFAVPQTPKSEECTALKHHHNGNMDNAKKHFENKLFQIFSAIENQTKDLVSIMFAHQSTEAWTTLCNSILRGRMNITGSWAVDTEMGSRMVAMDNAALQSSVTVSCRPSRKEGLGEFQTVKKAIENTVAKEVDELYKLGFRGADLLTACFGQAVSEFGKYQKVEKADGSEVTVAELLELAREAAFNALLKGFQGDDFTRFYIGWLQLYGFTESEFDDAAKFSRVGLSVNVSDLFTQNIFVRNGNKQTLANFADRVKENRRLGENPSSNLIDQVHRAMHLYKGTNRGNLLQYINLVGASPEGSFWRVINSLSEVLPPGSEDHKQAIGLLANKESLIRESQNIKKQTAHQGAFELE